MNHYEHEYSPELSYKEKWNANQRRQSSPSHDPLATVMPTAICGMKLR
jgi:hypothetical protein